VEEKVIKSFYSGEPIKNMRINTHIMPKDYKQGMTIIYYASIVEEKVKRIEGL